MRAQSGQCVTCAPKAWDYPPRGSSTASCGHRLYDYDPGEMISEAGWDCDAMDGYGRVVFTSCYCPWCAIMAKISGYYLPDEEAEEKWMDGDERR